jgi:isopenicillin N synthase-like dioxygenase
MGERTHGTRAERSNGREQHDVNTVSLELCSGTRTGVDADRRDVIGLIAGKRRMPWRHGTNDAPGSKLIESIDGKNHVQVDRNAGAVKVGTPMPKDEIASITWQQAVFSVTRLEALVSAAMQRCGRHDCHRRLGQQLGGHPRSILELGYGQTVTYTTHHHIARHLRPLIVVWGNASPPQLQEQRWCTPAAAPVLRETLDHDARGPPKADYPQCRPTRVHPMELPVIDFDTPLEQQAATMAAACETTGFFQLPLSVIPRQIADDAWTAAAEFFALPEAEKRLIEFPQAGYPYGYSPYKFETLAKSLDDGSPSGPDLKESLSVGPDCGHGTHPSAAGDQSWIRSPSLWPEHPAGLRSTWTAYYQELAQVAERLMMVMAVALELPADYFQTLIDQPITSMRALHYPAINGDAATNSLRAGAHSDYGTLTILRTDDVSGLEIRQGDGSWAGITPEPDMFVVNLGDSIEQWTNNRWRSTVHRVARTDIAPRQSFAFFHMANWDATIECLPTCRPEDQAPRHTPVQAGPWLMRKFTSTVT